MRPRRADVKRAVESLRTCDWRDIERRVLAALERDRAGSTVPDGHSMGGQGNGEGESRTELHAMARTARAFPRDELHSHVEHLWAFLQQAAQSTDAVRFRLHRIDVLTKDAPVNRRACECCEAAEIRDAVTNRHPAPAHYGNVGGRLDANMHLCDLCYAFVVRHGRPPSAEERRRHDMTGRWLVKAS